VQKHFRQLPLPSESSVECLPYSYLGLQVLLGLSYVPMYPRHTVCPPTPMVAHKNESYSVMHVPSPPLSITCLRTITRSVSSVRHWPDWSCWRVVGGEICHPLLSARARPSTVDSPGRPSHPQRTGPAPRTRSANAHAPATHRATLCIILAPVALFCSKGQTGVNACVSRSNVSNHAQHMRNSMLGNAPYQATIYKSLSVSRKVFQR
jgi:hypothetical protein